MLDIDQIRRDTPGVAHVTHLIAAGAALPPACVTEAIVDHLRLEERIGGYEAHAAQTETLDRVYADVAQLIGARAHEIALVENATVAWQHAFYAFPFAPGDVVLTCEAEYAANYIAFLQRARRDGLVIRVVPSDAEGEIDLAALEAMIDDRVRLIAITWVPTNGGLVNPAAGVGAIAKRHGVPYLLDACQAVGQMPVDVRALGCDFLSATGRKFLRGPRGTGFLYVSENWIDRLEPAMIDLFSASWVARDRYELRVDARRFETWENAYALRAGLGAAVRYALDIGLEAIQTRVRGLADHARTALRERLGAEIRDIGREQSGIVSFTVDGLEPRPTVAALRARAINIGASDPSSTRLDAEARNLPSLLRAAPHYYNTREEIDRMIDALRALAA